jgi:hypothetical protein
VIEGATVIVRNTETQLSQRVTTGKSGDFCAEDLPVGNYTVDAWHRFFERSSQTNIIVRPGSRERVSFNLDLCGMRHIDLHKRNFTILNEFDASSDFERDLANKAQRLPCRPNANDSSLLGWGGARCANLATMTFYSDQVRKNQAGHLPEEGEGPVLAGAYFGVAVEFDQPTKLWAAKLRLEYSLSCGMLCGIGATYDRRVFFDQSGVVIKVDDDCGCNLETIS